MNKFFIIISIILFSFVANAQENNKDYGQIHGNFETIIQAYQTDTIIGIDSDKTHREILNGCVYPFTQRGKISSELKYHFVRGSPLHELGEKNFDFLLYKPSDRSPVAVMGEAKGSVSKHSGIVKEALGRKQVALFPQFWKNHSARSKAKTR